MFCEIMMKKIAIPTREDMVDDHFGHCAYYTVVTLDDENQVQEKECLDSPEGCGCKSNIASVMQEMGITLMLAGLTKSFIHTHLRYALVQTLHLSIHAYLCLLIP